MKKEDLIVLAYDPKNSCYTCVVSIEEAENKYKDNGFFVNISSKKWNFRHGHANNEYQDVSIGNGRIGHSYNTRWGIIGVYDRNNNEHLSHMTNDARRATSDSSHSDD